MNIIVTDSAGKTHVFSSPRRVEANGSLASTDRVKFDFQPECNGENRIVSFTYEKTE